MTPAEIDAVARMALDEDLAGGRDITTEAAVPADHRCIADLTARVPGIIAGIPVATRVFELTLAGQGSIAATTSDGTQVVAGTVVLTLNGPTRAVLTAERSALNLICRLSGIATLTRRWVDAVRGTPAVIRDTRKTTPGLRSLEKYAVRCGGGQNHRLGLSDQALIKDNHVIAAGGVANAIATVRSRFPSVVCEVECDTLAQVKEAVDAGAALVLLDNMPVGEIRTAVQIARAAGARTEASGGLTLDNARDVAETGVDYLSVGALTHSAPALDIGLDLR